MYDFIEGKIDSRSAATVVVATAGIGYELRVPLGSPLPGLGQEARLYTHLAVREDAHTLFGFSDRPTRELFRTLLKVRGVGPSMALAVISGLSREELVQAITSGDVKALQRIKGVGKKTADQILLDLADRAESLASGLTVDGIVAPMPPKNQASGNIEDATQALVSIGYKESEARKLVEKAANEVDPTDLDELVRASIRL